MGNIVNKPLFLPSAAVAPISPTFGGGFAGVTHWTDTSQATRSGAAFDIKTGSAFAQFSASVGVGVATTRFVLIKQIICPAVGQVGRSPSGPVGNGPLAGLSILNPFRVRCRYTTALNVAALAGANTPGTTMQVWVAAPNLSNRNTLLAPSIAGQKANFNVLSTINTLNTNAVVNSGLMQTGDFLVVELGFNLNGAVTVTTGTLTVSFELGDSAAVFLSAGDTLQDNPGGSFNYFGPEFWQVKEI